MNPMDDPTRHLGESNWLFKTKRQTGNYARRSSIDVVAKINTKGIKEIRLSGVEELETMTSIKDRILHSLCLKEGMTNKNIYDILSKKENSQIGFYLNESKLNENDKIIDLIVEFNETIQIVMKSENDNSIYITKEESYALYTHPSQITRWELCTLEEETEDGFLVSFNIDKKNRKNLKRMRHNQEIFKLGSSQYSIIPISSVIK